MKARKIRRGESEREFEREIVMAMKPAERMALSWQIMANMLLMKGIDAASIRLDRSTARLERRRR